LYLSALFCCSNQNIINRHIEQCRKYD